MYVYMCIPPLYIPPLYQACDIKNAFIGTTVIVNDLSIFNNE